jgi:hypothetical protein
MIDSGARPFSLMIAGVSESWRCSTTSRRNGEKENLTIESREYLLQRNEHRRIELRVPATAYLRAARWHNLFVPVWSKWTQRSASKRATFGPHCRLIRFQFLREWSAITATRQGNREPNRATDVDR